MNQKLIQFFEDLTSGIHPSIPPLKVPLWIDGENIVFSTESIQPFPGNEVLFAKPAALPGLGITELLHPASGLGRLIFGNKISLYGWTAGDVTAVDLTRQNGVPAIVPYTLTEKDRWSIMPYGASVYATSGKDKPQVYSGSGIFVDIDSVTDLPSTFRASIFKKIGPFILALATDLSGQAVQWCDEDNPQVWEPGQGNLAGDMMIRDLDSDIYCAVDLASGIGVYGLDQLHIIRLVGSPFVFDQRKLLDGVGAFGKHSVVTVAGANFGIGTRGIWWTDGSTFDYIDDPAVHEYMYSRLNREYSMNSIAWDMPTEGLVVFSVPIDDSHYPNRTVAFSYRRRVWMPLGIARSCVSSGGVFDFSVSVSNTGAIYRDGVPGVVTTAAGKPILMPARVVLEAGFGVAGFGELGYGGIRYLDA